MRLPVRCLEITTIERSLSELARLGVDPEARRTMAPKQLHYNLKVEGLTAEQATKVKEDIRALGAEVFLADGAAPAEAILSGTLEGLRALTERLGKNPAVSSVAVYLNEALENYSRKEFILRSRGKEFKIGPYTLIMGILNVTPDSFSDGGFFFDRNRAVERAFEMREEGADWIDIGGESTRPGAVPVPLKEELERVIPVVEAVSGKGFTVSVDTTKAGVAKAALEAGAMIINDVSAMGMDESMAGVCARYGCAVVLMHMRGTPETMQKDTVYKDLVPEVYGYLSSRVEFAAEKGIGKDSIIIDPGLGFGKSVEGNLRIVKDLKEFKSLGVPVLVGPSRKSFIGRTLGADTDRRLSGTLAVSVISILNGANILRVHDVKVAKEAVRMADAVRMS